jgi:cystathionine beta-lyase
VINRKNTDCYKWDTTKDGVIPMWVADMDFEVAKSIAFKKLFKIAFIIQDYDLYRVLLI